MTFYRISPLVFASLLLVGCRPPADKLSPDQRENLQSRVTNSFAYTALFKPGESESDASPALRLAPLIIQEVADTNATALWQDQFGGVAGPWVRCEPDTLDLNGRPHERFAYSWTYASAGRSGRKAQGIRVTLNTAGEPVIWEVLQDSSGAEILYVAQSLELAARAEHGPPLPGRRFSIERSLADAPNTVVANVIDDGPTPMGPVVYLRAETREVSTVICRCMASQGGTLLGQTNYGFGLELVVRPGGTPGHFPRAQPEPHLRLPRSF